MSSCSACTLKRVLKTLTPTDTVLEASTMLSYTRLEQHKLMDHMQTPLEPAYRPPRYIGTPAQDTHARIMLILRLIP